MTALAALTGMTMFGQDVRRNRNLKKAAEVEFSQNASKTVRPD